MKKKPFHVIRSVGKEFTQDEWNEYLNAVYAVKCEHISTCFGKYVFNDHDICVNYDTQTIGIKNMDCYGYYVTLEFAECGNGIWVYGLNYNIGTAGGGFGAAWSDTTDDKIWYHGYPSEKDCKLAGWNEALQRISNNDSERSSQIKNLRTMIEDEIKKLTRPQVVQLELFM